MAISPSRCAQERRQGTILGKSAPPEILEIQFGEEEGNECDAAKYDGENDCEGGASDNGPFSCSRGFG
jgi:hypothetical protein